jgi:hypothetical protein
MFTGENDLVYGFAASLLLQATHLRRLAAARRPDDRSKAALLHYANELEAEVVKLVNQASTPKSKTGWW